MVRLAISHTRAGWPRKPCILSDRLGEFSHGRILRALVYAPKGSDGDGDGDVGVAG